MQWAWFGGAFALGDYYSCVDYTISGGPTSAKQAAFFLPGDYTYAASLNKCKFFNTDRLHQCVNEPCNNPVYTLSQERSGAPFGISGSSPSPTPTPTTPTQPTTSMCYVSGTPFINAKLGKNGRCGTKTSTRCADGSCCSKYGYCGTSADYCTNNQGDYRKYQCSTLSNGVPINQSYLSYGEEDNDLEASSGLSHFYNIGICLIGMLAFMLI